MQKRKYRVWLLVGAAVVAAGPQADSAVAATTNRVVKAYNQLFLNIGNPP